NSTASINFSFTGFSARGGQTGEHADGWGIAFHERTGCRGFIDDGRASDSALADFVRSYPIKSKSVLAHIRKATQGAVTLSNCHPWHLQFPAVQRRGHLCALLYQIELAVAPAPVPDRAPDRLRHDAGSAPDQ